MSTHREPSRVTVSRWKKKKKISRTIKTKDCWRYFRTNESFLPFYFIDQSESGPGGFTNRRFCVQGCSLGQWEVALFLRLAHLPFENRPSTTRTLLLILLIPPPPSLLLLLLWSRCWDHEISEVFALRAGPKRVLNCIGRPFECENTRGCKTGRLNAPPDPPLRPKKFLFPLCFLSPRLLLARYTFDSCHGSIFGDE